MAMKVNGGSPTTKSPSGSRRPPVRPARGKVPVDGVMDTEVAAESGTVEVSVAIKKDTRKRGVDFETKRNFTEPAPAQPGTPTNRDGIARARSGLAVTLSFDFQSVRVEAAVELPCAADEESIKEALSEGYRMASAAMKPEVGDAKEFLAGGKAEIFGDG